MIKTVIKRNGSTEEFQADKLNKWVEWSDKAHGAGWSEIVLKVVSSLPEQATSKQIQEAAIKFCLNKRTWAANQMAGRLYAALMLKDIHGSDKYPTVKEVHDNLFKAGLMVKLDYSDLEYKQVESFINHNLNFQSAHYSLQQCRTKYALRNKKTGKEYETPQFVYMRMAMALAEQEPKETRMKDVERFYYYFSNKIINCPTPYYVNLGTNLNGYASCFPAGTMVDTMYGQKEITSISIGDKVLGKSGNYCSVIATTQRNYSGKLIGVDTSVTYNGFVKSTEDHRFLVKKLGTTTVDWVQAKDIRVGDSIFYPKAKENNYDVFVWDLVKDVPVFDQFAVVDGLIGKVNVCDNAGDFSKKIKTCRNINIKNNKDFYRFLGYFMAEGHVTESPKDNRIVTGLTFHAKDKDFISDAKKILEDLFGVDVCVYDDSEKDNCIRLHCNSIVVGNLVKKICGKGALHKKDNIGFILQSSNEALEHFVAGYMRGDGCAVATGYVSSSISKNLTNLIRDCSLKLGYSCSSNVSKVRSVTSYKNGKDSFVVRITLQPTDSLAVLTNKNLEKIKMRGTIGKVDYTKFVENGAFSRVNKITTEDFSGIVYDFEVENDHSFTVDGMCVHNCAVYSAGDTWKSLAAGDHFAYAMTAMSAGIGTHIKTRSIGDPIRGGLIQHQGKIPYYRSVVAAVSANLQNGRGGASTVHYTCFDPEAETIEKLKNPMTPLVKQVRGVDYSLGTNKFFARKAAKDEDVHLFSYLDAPDLYEAQYSKDQSEFERLYEKYEKDGKLGKKVKARQLILGALQEGFETGRFYLHFMDAMNQHTPFKEKIYSSNLC